MLTIIYFTFVAILLSQFAASVNIQISRPPNLSRKLILNFLLPPRISCLAQRHCPFFDQHQLQSSSTFYFTGIIVFIFSFNTKVFCCLCCFLQIRIASHCTLLLNTLKMRKHVFNNRLVILNLYEDTQCLLHYLH